MHLNKKPLGPLTLAFSSASIDTEQRHAKREWIKNKDREREILRGGGGGQAFLSKTSLNRHGQTKRPASRVRRAFQSEARVQPYSTAHNNE